MSLQPGNRLGAYEIVSLLGVGGMGEVYRAHDTKLNRDVAIKVLLAAVAEDPERLARFQREAQLLASLNHPHIGAIYGLEDARSTLREPQGRPEQGLEATSSGRAGDVRALVMELVEGPTLADRIASGPVPLDEALPIARQIAEALETAHEQGIIHRDLKPANIKVRPDGTVKVLDFGLAKAFDPGGGSRPNATMSPTLSLHATHAGLILGTAAYMAPEQARGRAVDRRVDIWAFGVVFFEMLTGRRAFEGDDISITLAAVLKDDLNWNALPPETPPHIRTLLRRCLQKDPQKRLPHIGLARIEIEEGQSGVLASSPGLAQSISSPLPTPPRPLWKRAMPAALAAVVAAALGGLAVWTFKPATARLPIVRFHTSLSEVAAVFNAPTRQTIAISPDGSAIAVTAANGLFLHRLTDDQMTQLVPASNEESVSNPFFSPDGRWIGFFSGAGGGSSIGTLKKIAVTGGPPITLCPSDPPFGASWSDGAILFSTSKGILRVAEYGGTAENLVRGGQLMQSPQLLAGGDALLFAVGQNGGVNGWNRAQIVLRSLKTGQRRTLIDGGTDPRYVRTGHLVYALGGVLFAVPFDVRRLEVTGGPVPVVEGVRRAAVAGAALFGFSDTGSLAYVPGPSAGDATNVNLAWTEKDGGRASLQVPPAQYETPRISPDGLHVAVGNTDSSGLNIWIVDLSGANQLRRLTFGGKNAYPVWSPDGERIAFQSDREGDPGIFWQRADGTGTAERLSKAESGVAYVPESWAPDGKRLLFSKAKGNDVSLWVLSFPELKAEPFSGAHSTRLMNAMFSPDGRWVAYGSDESGTDAVYVQPFPITGAKSQISRGDVGHHALWSRDGKQLFYIPGPGRFAVVNVTTQPSFSVSAPVPAPRAFNIGNAQTSPRSHDIGPDGRMLGIVNARPEASAPGAAQQINVVLNWFEELKQRVPVNK
jgi:serine/threonine-protein kinase